LHQAALAGHLDIVRFLVERGARTDIEDVLYGATPLGWAEPAKRTDVIEYLRSVTRT
jgi:ankyrin repeat protein